MLFPNMLPLYDNPEFICFKIVYINVLVMTVTSSAPPASTAAPAVSGTNVSNSVAPATTSGVCSDIEDVNFKCADYIRDFDICNQNTGTGSVLASTRCKMSCGLCPGNTTFSHRNERLSKDLL